MSDNKQTPHPEPIPEKYYRYIKEQFENLHNPEHRYLWDEVDKNKMFLETDNAYVALHIFASDDLAFAVGYSVFDPEMIVRYNDEAYNQIKIALEMDVGNPHLWWKLAFLLQFFEHRDNWESRYKQEFVGALVNVIAFAQNKKYTRIENDVWLARRILKDRFGIEA